MVLLLTLSLIFGYIVSATKGNAIIVSSDKEATPPSFGKGLSTHNLQAWSSWLKKRTALQGNWGPILPMGQHNPQDWSGLLQKRGFGFGGQFPTPSNKAVGSFKHFTDWMTKKGFGIGGAFPGTSRSGFQQWQNWLSKRGNLKRDWDSPVEGFGSQTNNGADFQSWHMSGKRSWDTPVAGFGRNTGDSTFQRWNGVSRREWDSPVPGFGTKSDDIAAFQRWRPGKRSWDRPVAGFGRYTGDDTFQRWNGLKRDWDTPVAGFGQNNGETSAFQSWHGSKKRDWDTPVEGFGRQNGDDLRLQTWIERLVYGTDKESKDNTSDKVLKTVFKERFGKRHLTDRVKTVDTSFEDTSKPADVDNNVQN